MTRTCIINSGLRVATAPLEANSSLEDDQQTPDHPYPNLIEHTDDVLATRHNQKPNTQVTSHLPYVSFNYIPQTHLNINIINTAIFFFSAIVHLIRFLDDKQVDHDDNNNIDKANQQSMHNISQAPTMV
ncbi:hypothetical protein M8J77_026363 [Diaphorina citri]|nr:hypothetical protein M8J77_026363 [Diaphorina citri]